MNYLAHLYLAGAEPAGAQPAGAQPAGAQPAGAQPEAIVGSLLGDFVKGPLTASKFSPGLTRAVALHRKIDAYTDAHPLVRRSKQRLQPQWRRYGGILIDIFYDHLLAQQWRQYSRVPLAQFSQSVYAILAQCFATLPEQMQRSVSFMLAQDLLVSYGAIEGVERALRGLERRLKRPYPLSAAVVDLREQHAGLSEDFADYFPHLIAYAAQAQAELEQAIPCQQPTTLFNAPSTATTTNHPIT